jgi:DNA-binding IclR family transcriptional regulator
MQVKQARQEGYAISCGEVFIGAFNISAPIRDYICPAALNILGPEHRLKSKATEIAKELKASVARIEKKIL